jgi:hypothetical protein
MKNGTFDHYIASLSKDAHNPEGNRGAQNTPNMIRKADRSWAKSDSEKAMTFAEHLEQVFTPLSNINPNDRETENFLEIPCQMSLPIKPFSPREVI